MNKYFDPNFGQKKFYFSRQLGPNTILASSSMKDRQMKKIKKNDPEEKIRNEYVIRSIQLGKSSQKGPLFEALLNSVKEPQYPKELMKIKAIQKRGKTISIATKYYYIQKSLQRLTEKRRQKSSKELFSNEELKTILSGLLRTMSYFHQKG